MNGDWEEIDDCFDTPFASLSILDDPRKIYEYLRSKVYKQDEACKAAAMILYNHVKGITSRSLFCGSAGCGKSYMWNLIKEKLYPHVIIADASTMTKTGWSGNNKISSPLYQINPCVRTGYIIVYDEFDKLCKPQYSRGDENVSACVQSELLTLIQPSNEYMRLKSSDGKERTIKVDNISYVFCGSFAEAAQNEAEKECSSGLGFGAVKKEIKAFDKELTMQNLIKFGVIPEVASRVSKIVNLRPLGESDYSYLINHHQNSPIKRIEDMYSLERGFIEKNVLNEDELHQIAIDAFKSGLGVRSVTSAIQRKVDDYIFEHFDHMHYLD